MSPDEIAATYEVLAPMSTDYANANLERAGQAQASYGPLAEAAMGGSRTAGIGNYTYNRLVRPAVDTMRDQLIVEGYSNALNKQISDSLRNAQENYNRASRRYTRSGGSTGTGKNTPGGVTIDDEILGGSADDGVEVGSKEFAGSKVKDLSSTKTYDIVENGRTIGPITIKRNANGEIESIQAQGINYDGKYAQNAWDTNFSKRNLVER